MATRSKKSRRGSPAARSRRGGSTATGGRSRRAAGGGRARGAARPGRSGRAASGGTARSTSTASRRGAAGRPGRAGTRRGARATATRDALGFLKDEHEQVSRLFDEFERVAHGRGGSDLQRKGDLATEICRQLENHASLEEEIFYPAAAEAIDDDELIPEARVEHQSAKELIGRIERMDADEELYDATVRVLGEYVRHHVREEEDELFPKVKRSGLDLQALGERLRERRAQAMAM